ncbi:peptidoglycan bridge formation protein FemAB [Iodidimonas nitroreducens]|uniref:Peptidoglycan bridge formation protein FemAB n=1 Tax=Iodidimonas nitroreducens TaxID=1236968 RepID=A0A5A7N9Q2_9PROT|nr:FemAB family XrtA/PEP-CTERM system-associated protein [Iodidimonas nitroreducens]GER04828.1 peptidoglycan bridge formation protein FemAB [Iodidimonas nitroreducens]
MMHGTQPISITPLEPGDHDRWDAFVMAHEAGSFFHLSGWQQVISQAFGHETHYLMAQSGGQVRAVLPLVHIKSALFGDSLVSTAFCVEGGPLWSDPGALAALDAAAVALAEKLAVGHLEYRLITPLHALDDRWESQSDLYVRFRKSFTMDADENLKMIPRKQRAMVRKGIKCGLSGVTTDDPDALHAVYAESVRNLGTPVFSKRYFRLLKQIFGDRCELLLIKQGDETISGVLSFRFRNEILPYYGGGTAKARDLAANDFMYWETLRRAVERGETVFDFGRSKCGTGSYDFKKHWGFEPQPLSYEYRLIRAAAVPSNNPLNPKYRLAIALWQRLPLWAANRIGPYLSRSLG